MWCIVNTLPTLDNVSGTMYKDEAWQKISLTLLGNCSRVFRELGSKNELPKGPLMRAQASSVSAQAAHPQLRLEQQRLRSRD
jgi:hypothetical protein